MQHINPRDCASRAAAFTFALKPQNDDIERELYANAHEIDWLWRLHDGDWNEPQVVAALVEGAAQIAWNSAYRHSEKRRPQFAVTLATWPRCLRILLPDHSRHFGDVIVWLRYFEALMPSDAPTYHLLPAPRARCAIIQLHGQWLWCCMSFEPKITPAIDGG